MLLCIIANLQTHLSQKEAKPSTVLKVNTVCIKNKHAKVNMLTIKLNILTIILRFKKNTYICAESPALFEVLSST